MNNSRKPVTALVALGAALVMPLAFAQSETTAGTEATAQSTRTATTNVTAEQAPTAETAKKVTWADLDGDKDGKLTKTEVAPLDSLSQVFDKADANADGALTADEYKAYIANNGKSMGGKEG